MTDKLSFNPFLPPGEYVPDGEPRLFNERVFLYGSHDRFGGRIFCLNDYVCYSAQASDLSQWRYEGVIYRKRDDPMNRKGLRLLFAPDVAKGPDGAYYLYYALDFMGLMGVARSESPAGPFEFLGHVRHRDGTLWGRRRRDDFPFDPGVLTDEDGRIFLYSGFAKAIPSLLTGFRKLDSRGGVVLELESDMLTIKEEPRLLFPFRGDGSFPGHEFFEASSIRKRDGKYYFVYSSRHNHELCYGVSDYPDHGFVFGGTLVSLGDISLRGISREKDGVNYLGNTHGGLLFLEDKSYIFYHRQTNRHSYSRQACAEELLRDERGGLKQAEVTSCGLNGGPLPGKGRYEARIACMLKSRHGVGRYDALFPRLRFRKHPCFTQEKGDGEDGAFQYIAGMRNGAVAGFKYFLWEDARRIALGIRGRGKGAFLLSQREDFSSIAARIPVEAGRGSALRVLTAPFSGLNGVFPLFIKFTGKGILDLYYFELE